MRRELVRAVAREFARRGYAGTKERDILAAVGVTSPTMYHFASKADL